MIELPTASIGRRTYANRSGKRGIISGDHPQFIQRQLARYVFHAGIFAPAACIGLELRSKVACIDRGETGGVGTVALAVATMTGEARIRGACVAAAERNQFTGLGKAVGSGTLGDATARRKHQAQGGKTSWADGRGEHDFCGTSAG
jgi:hypothetical protein